MERAPGRPSAQTSTLKPAGTLSLSTGSSFAALPVTSIANGCRGDFSCSALRPCCQEGGAAGAAGACACAAAADNTQTSAEVREMCDRNGAGDMEYPPFPGCCGLRGGAAVQSTGRHGIIATLDPGRNRLRREAAPRLRRCAGQPRQTSPQARQLSSRGFGSRARCGVRGVGLCADGTPATSPDGQGQTSNFDLGAAERIEVMRGPFSTLYGNASGGVIQIFTEDGPPEPTLTLNGAAGSYGTSRSGLKFGGQSGALNYIGGASHLETTGYRDHSAAEKDLGNAKLKLALSDDTRLAFILNAVRQPAQDPAGLNRAQVEQNPRQVDPSVILFNTRKSVVQNQLGTTVEHRLSASDSLRFAAYGGSRQVEQFLAIPIAAQTPSPTSSGGVVNLDRFYYGLDLRWSRATDLAGQPFAFAFGSDYDNQKERRRGYINRFGTNLGELKRDEDDTVRSAALYAQGDWKFAPRWSASAGLRHTEVSFYSSDYYIATGNPDDSGNIKFTNTSPAAGLDHESRPW